VVTWFVISVEEELSPDEAEALLSDFEEAVAKKNYSLDISKVD